MKRDHPVRKKFEARRSWSSFVSGMFAGAAVVFGGDFWFFGPGAGPAHDPLFVVAATSGLGVAAGLSAFALVYGYETLMWRRHYGAVAE